MGGSFNIEIRPQSSERDGFSPTPRGAAAAQVYGLPPTNLSLLNAKKLNGAIAPNEWRGGEPRFPEDRSLQYFPVRWWT